jgi:hypothetical protein
VLMASAAERPDVYSLRSDHVFRSVGAECNRKWSNITLLQSVKLLGPMIYKHLVPLGRSPRSPSTHFSPTGRCTVLTIGERAHVRSFAVGSHREERGEEQ